MSNRTLAALTVACAVLGAIILGAGARADEATVDVACGPLSAMKDREHYRPLSHDEWIAARVMFYLAPDTPAQFPPGDGALIRELDDGSASIVYVDGEEGCAPMRLMKQGAQLLEQIKVGVLTHPPGKM